MLINLTGKQFGRLKVLKRVENDKWGKPRWLCRCNCKSEIIILGKHLRGGNTKSCGCLVTKHGRSEDKIYYIWKAMIQRCTNPNNKRYKDYGGRGITVCERWMKFENFLEDMGERPEGLSLDRKNNNKNYCKSNCRWVTSKQQNRNARSNRLISFNGKTQCLSAWAEETKIPYDTLYARIYKLGWLSEKALTTRVKKYNIR